MPMNRFLFNHQLAALNADGSGTPEERSAQAELIGTRAKQMSDWRQANGLSNAGWPKDERPTSSIAMSEVTDHSTKLGGDQVGTAAWENEGGAIKPGSVTDLPEEVTLVLSNEYWVGQYRYTNLKDALAEHQRQASSKL